MIRGWSWQGVEICGWEVLAVKQVSEGSVETSQCWVCSLVSPGVSLVKERDFHDSDVLDGVVEGFSEGGVEIRVVFRTVIMIASVF